MTNPVDQRGETIRVGAIMGVPPVAPVAHEPGEFEHGEMFGDGGLRNPGLVSERAHGQLAVAAQPFEDGAASRVGKAAEKLFRLHAKPITNRLWIVKCRSLSPMPARLFEIRRSHAAKLQVTAL